MSEERVSGVKIKDTPNKDKEKNYAQSDVAVVLRRGDWHSWDEAIGCWPNTARPTTSSRRVKSSP
ncbi:MAG: hypothetical protein ABIT83_04030 [Massilia sp.]